MKPKHGRARLWIDPAFQFRLLFRIGLYFLLYTVVVWHVGFLLQLANAILRSGVGQGFGRLYLDYVEQQKPLLFALVLILPILLRDLLKFSHRIAGPLYRCRKMMQEMASGKPVPEFQPRKHDQMRELFAAFNALIKEWNARVSAGANGHVGGGEMSQAKAAAFDARSGNGDVAGAQRIGV